MIEPRIKNYTWLNRTSNEKHIHFCIHFEQPYVVQPKADLTACRVNENNEIQSELLDFDSIAVATDKRRIKFIDVEPYR